MIRRDATVATLGARLRAGSITAVEAAEAAMSRIAALDDSVHAFVSVTGDLARDRARRADECLASGRDLGPLHGIPYALKDIIDVAGLTTSCCSRLGPAAAATADAGVEALLRQSGAVLIGKTTTHEFALGGPSFELPFPPARNPYDLSRYAGGSSSGSAVAVAADMVPLTIGSDTSGSIRGPASYCGVVGLKPSFGLVPRSGVFPLSHSLDHVGPMARTVEDVALAMNVIAAHDRCDPSSVAAPEADFTAELDIEAGALRIGYARAFFREDCAPDLLAMLDHLADDLARAGADVAEVELPDFDLFSACGRLLMTAEGYAVHEAALHARPTDFGRYTYQRLMPGFAISAADYLQAQRLRGELTRALNHGALAQHDVLLLGSAMTAAPPLSSFGDVWPPRTSMRTIPFTVTGNPAITLPIGHDAAGLPFAAQLVGRAFADARLLGAAALVERLRAPHVAAPAIADIATARTA